VFPVRYEQGFYIPVDDILHSHCREHLRYFRDSCSLDCNIHIRVFEGAFRLYEGNYEEWHYVICYIVRDVSEKLCASICMDSTQKSIKLLGFIIFRRKQEDLGEVTHSVLLCPPRIVDEITGDLTRVPVFCSRILYELWHCLLNYLWYTKEG
jgi:hypothetical protein